MNEYPRHVDDKTDHCFFCQSQIDLQNHYIPSRDQYKSVGSERYVVTACGGCRGLIYNYRALKNTLELHLEFFATKGMKKTPGHDVSSSFVRISAEDQSLGYQVHEKAVPGTCFYCSAPMRGTRDFIPCKLTVKDYPSSAKYVVPACTTCIGRIKPKEFVFDTIEKRQSHIDRLLMSNKARSMKNFVRTQPWQRAMYDGAGIRYVLDIDEMFLTVSEKEAKDAWTLEQSKLTT